MRRILDEQMDVTFPSTRLSGRGAVSQILRLIVLIHHHHGIIAMNGVL